MPPKSGDKNIYNTNSANTLACGNNINIKLFLNY